MLRQRLPGASCTGERGSCCEQFKAWIGYRPCQKTCCGCGQHERATPPLYTYFLNPGCKEGCGPHCCDQGCGHLNQRCGFCASGPRMLGMTTGHGFGLAGGVGVMK